MVKEKYTSHDIQNANNGPKCIDAANTKHFMRCVAEDLQVNQAFLFFYEVGSILWFLGSESEWANPQYTTLAVFPSKCPYRTKTGKSCILRVGSLWL